MDGGRDQFVKSLGKFRAKLNKSKIPVGISEDWDRPGIMSSSDKRTLGPVGQGVRQNSDVAHIHPMPFYHGNPPQSKAWAYIQEQTQWVLDNVKLPTMITETQWAWGVTDHYPGKSDVGVQQYRDFWRTIDNNCAWFREKNVGWFHHSWRGEGTMDIFGPNGQYIIPNWRPIKC